MTPDAQSKAARQRNELRDQAETIARLRREKMELLRDLRADEAAMADRIEALEALAFNPDFIAQAIRTADGNHTMGAGVLGEAIVNAIRAALGETSDG